MKQATIAAIASVFLVSPVTAARLSGAEIQQLIAGKTVYLELTAASSVATPGQGVLFFAGDGSVLYKTPKGEMWHGTWTIKGNTVCGTFKEFPNNPCTKYDKQGDTITLLNAATGQQRAKLLKTVAGNVENLRP